MMQFRRSVSYFSKFRSQSKVIGVKSQIYNFLPDNWKTAIFVSKGVENLQFEFVFFKFSEIDLTIYRPLGKKRLFFKSGSEASPSVVPFFFAPLGWFVTADFRSKSISATVFSLPLNVPDLQSPTAPGLRGVFKLASALHRISVFCVFSCFSLF